MTDGEIFRLSDSSPEESWLHGKGLLRSWFSGSLPSEGQNEFSAEFDLELRGRLGARVADTLNLNAEALGSGHVGILTRIDFPMDLYRGAGLFAVVRAEASATAQISVEASLKLDQLGAIVSGQIPVVARPYAKILFDEAEFSAGVWARGAFAAMAVGELVVALSLFPADGSPPGITAHLRYGYAWGWGAGWGTVVNIGFPPDRVLERVAFQASVDIQQTVNDIRVAENLKVGDPLYALTELADSILPRILTLLVRLAYLSVTDRLDEDLKQSLLDECVITLRTGLGTALLSRLGQLCVDWLPDDLDFQDVDGDAYRKLEEARYGLLAAAAGDDATHGPDVFNAALKSVFAIATTPGLLAPELQAAIKAALRCTVALVLLVGPDEQLDKEKLGELFLGSADGGTTAERAISTLTTELGALLTEHQIMPDWMSALVGNAANLVGILVADESRDRSADARIFLRLMKTVAAEVLDGELWAKAANGLPTDIRDALGGAVTLLEEFCTEVLDGKGLNLVRFREGLSVCLLTAIETPLTRILHEVANHGLRAVPASLNRLADQADVGAIPVNLRSSWEDLGRAWLGVSFGLPIAVPLRKTAATVQNWCDTVLPEELDFLNRSLALNGVCQRMREVGSAPALAQFRLKLYAELGKHLGKHVIDSLEFSVRESADLFDALISSVVDSIAQSLALLVVAPFKALEASVAAAEKALAKLRQDAAAASERITRLHAGFLASAGSVANRVKQSVETLKDLLVQAIIDRLIPDVLKQVKIRVPGVSEDLVRSVVAEAVRQSTGGLLDAAAHVCSVMASTLSIGAEALLETAEGQTGSSIRTLLTTQWNDSMPTVTVPITVEIPVPPLPPIIVKLGDLTVPSVVVASMTQGILLDALGIGPLLDSLDVTVASLRGTRIALATLRTQIENSTAPKQRNDLTRAKADGALSIDIVDPRPAATVPSRGQITFVVRGANLSFTDPARGNLPAGLPRRIKVLLDGVDVTAHTTWTQPQPSALHGSIRYDASRTPTATDGQVHVGPIGISVVVNDGFGASAQEAWQVITEAPATPPGFTPVVQGRQGRGIGSYDLMSPADQVLAFDYEHRGRLDHLVLYRPGSGVVHILKNDGGRFSPVFAAPGSKHGIGSYDLMSPADRAFAFDFDHSGKLDHLVLYRPGSGVVHILKNDGGRFSPVFATPGSKHGIGSYDLMSPADRAFAFDFDHSGKLDHLVLYRPGTGTVHILKNQAGVFAPVYAQGAPGKGIGSYDLKSPADRAFAFDFNHSGKQDHLVLYRPGSGVVHILKNDGGRFSPVFATPGTTHGIGGYDLMSGADRMLAFDYQHSGRLDHLVLYRPGRGAIFVVRGNNGVFSAVYAQGDPGNGAGDYSISSPADQMFAYDYAGSASQDYLGLYRPGAGLVWIIKSTAEMRRTTLAAAITVLAASPKPQNPALVALSDPMQQ